MGVCGRHCACCRFCIGCRRSGCDRGDTESWVAVDANGWEEIEMGVDSGATETVVDEQHLRAIPTVEGEARRRGVEYEVATGELIPNLGEKRFIAALENDVLRKLTVQVADINQPLLAVRRMMAVGNRAVFDSDGSYIEDRGAGERIWMTGAGGMYSLKLWEQQSC